MKATFYKGVLLGAVVGSVTLIASAALAGTSVGVLNLGKRNLVNAPTQLRGSVNTGQLQLVNSSAGSAATGSLSASPKDTRRS